MFELHYPQRIWMFFLISKSDAIVNYGTEYQFERLYGKEFRLRIYYYSDKKIYVVAKFNVNAKAERRLEICNDEKEARDFLMEYMNRMKKRYEFKESLK